MFGDKKPAPRRSGPDSPGRRRAEAEAKVEFYVTDGYNGIRFCKGIAPDFIGRIEYAYSCFMARQPQSSRGFDLLRNASSPCALDAIYETVKVQA